MAVDNASSTAADNSPVFVVGTGPAGLAAAMVLSRSGVPVRLIDRSQLVGGKVNSHHESGYSLEHGVHGWWVNYLNFDRLMAWSGINPGDALTEPRGSTLIMVDGQRFPLHTLTSRLPSPLFFVWQFLRAPFLDLADFVSTLGFGVHALAFRHESDYAAYDNFSFRDLMNSCHVSQRVQRLLLEPYILSFDFTTPDRVSAACGLSGLQFYLLRDQQSVLARWARGLPSDVLFTPIVERLQQLGVSLSLNTDLQSIVGDDSGVTGVQLAGPPGAPPAPTTAVPAPAGGQVVLAEVALAAVPDGGFLQFATSIGPIWITRAGASPSALSARCTHMGCTVALDPGGGGFTCPCHGGRFNSQGQVILGPPTLPLESLPCRVNGPMAPVLGQQPAPTTSCSDVILATDVEGAQAIISSSLNLPTELRHNVGHLSTTPVLVVRIWFDPTVKLIPDVDTAVTPGFIFIDNFFHLNSFDESIADEGEVIEVQAYRAAHLFSSDDETILNIALVDLLNVNPAYVRTGVKHFTINRIASLFTLYSPLQDQFRPTEQSGVQGLYLAGDWTQAPWSVWMQERAVVSGIRAANAVLQRRGRSEVPPLQLPSESIVLRLSRLIALLLRLTILRRLPMANAPTADALSAHLERDHRINGWVILAAAIGMFLPLFSSQFSILREVWEFPMMAVALYFFAHTEPDVWYQYGSWLRSWADTPSLQHRVMTVGTVVGCLAELALAGGLTRSQWVGILFPAGWVGAGVIFSMHHHGSDIVGREHRIMATLFVAIGIVWLAARVLPVFASLNYGWPLLMAIQAYLFLTYTEGVQPPAAGGDGHVHDHTG